MLDLPWTAALSTESLSLADAIELFVAFDSESFGGRFTRANYLQWVSMEEFDSNDQDYMSGDDVDKQNAQFDQAITLMRNRADWLKHLYPYEVGDNEVAISAGYLDKVTLPYLFLLLCSHGSAAPHLQHELPIYFEHICKEAFGELFPAWAEVVLFSKDSDDRKELFGSSASQALKVLAEKLNTSVKHGIELPTTQREFGIDLIAICSLDDGAPYPPFAFAQCTIQEKWWEKRHEARADNELTGFIDLNAGHLNFLMIPHFPRYSLTQWSVDGGRSGNCIICDRMRICTLLNRSDSFRDGQSLSAIVKVLESLRDNAQPSPV